MSGVFIDTNTLVYADQSASQFHARARAALAELERGSSELWISRQVIREYLSAVTRPGPDGRAPMTRSDAAAAVEAFEQVYRVAEDGPETTSSLLKLVRQVPLGGKQVHDANIVATMTAHGITRLLTFNQADFRRFENSIELSPA